MERIKAKSLIESSDDEDHTFKDHMGDDIVIKNFPPKRIVSIVPS